MLMQFLGYQDIQCQHPNYHQSNKQYPIYFSLLCLQLASMHQQLYSKQKKAKNKEDQQIPSVYIQLQALNLLLNQYCQYFQQCGDIQDQFHDLMIITAIHNLQIKMMIFDRYIVYIFSHILIEFRMLGKHIKMMTNKILPDVPKHKNKRRNRTFCRPASPNKYKKHRESTTQCIVVDTLNDIFEEIYGRIDNINERRFYQEIKSNINNFANNLLYLNDPEHQQNPVSLIIPEKQPERNQIDPIIGLDKNVIIQKSKRPSIHLETQVNNIEKKSSKHIEINSKKLIKFSSKQLKQRSKSSTKLIPLPRASTSLVNDIKAQDFYRDKILKEIDHKNMLSMISTQPNAFKTTLGGAISSNTKKEEYNYDYNGDKINLVKNNQLKNHCNIIRSIYKFSKEQHTQLYGKEQSSLIKFNSGRKQQQIADGKLLNQTVSLTSLQLSVKSRLENEMRKNKLQFKTVFAD